MTFQEFCIERYAQIYQDEIAAATNAASGRRSISKLEEIERSSQKRAIRNTTIEAMEQFPNIDATRIWKSVYSAHINRKSGVADPDTIRKVVSAENSWKKSSGHAFEEIIEVIGNRKLIPHGIRILLQKDLKLLLEAGGLANKEPDITWLRAQISHSIFDLYITLKTDQGDEFVYGCIQSKTSIRDRVTRDREPSIAAMGNFFWSVAICLDGDFLRLPKFIGMVNGNTQEHVINGWHGLYVLSDRYSVDRIYPIDIELDLFVDHALQAAEQWRNQRQWFTHMWKAR